MNTSNPRDKGDSLSHLRLAARTAGLGNYEVALPDDLWVSANGLEFHYVDWGNRSADAMVFLHGGGLTARTWDLMCLGFRDTYHCVAVDLRGHGDSSWASDGEYDFKTLASDLAEIADAMLLEPFVLVGMSLGAAAAIAYSIRPDSRQRALVLIEPGPQPRPNEQAPPVSRVRDFMAGPAEFASVEGFVERALAFNPKRNAELLRRSLLHNLRQLPNGNWTWKYDRESLLKRDLTAMAASRKELWDQLHLIQCPTLVVRGSESDVFSDQDARALAAGITQGSRVTVEGSGHTVQGDNPLGLLNAMRRFLRQINGFGI